MNCYKDICFVILCYNNLDLTRDCVNSILKNSPENKFGFIFVDNGSTDETSYFLNFIPNSIVIKNEYNNFVNPAWNQAIQKFLESDYYYLCLINNDVIVGKNWLNDIFDAFERRHGEIYIPASNNEPEPDFYGKDGFYEYQRKEIKLKFKPYTISFPGFCMFMKREYIKLFYPIPDKLSVLRGDDWIFDNLYNNGIVPTKVSTCPVYHFLRATQQSINGLDNVRDRDCAVFNDIVREIYPTRYMRRIEEKLPYPKLL